MTTATTTTGDKVHLGRALDALAHELDGDVIRGAVHQVDEHHEPDLLWALRGGGGNFGVVTEFTYRLHPVGPDVFVGFVVYHADRMAEVLRAYREYTAELDDAVSSFAICGTIPEADEFPERSWGQPCVMLVACAAADLAVGERLVQPLRDLGDPIADLSSAMPYLELQQLFDEDYPDGMRYYWKSLHLPELSDDAIALSADWAQRRPSPLSTVELWHLGGAIARVPADATAYGDRHAPYLLNVEANWQHADDDEANLAWARGCVEAFLDASTGREYLNFLGFLEDAQATLRVAHGDANYARLAQLKRRVDPDNRFRLHQNIPPA